MSAPTIGTTDTASPVASLPNSPVMARPGTSSDISAPQFAAALSVATAVQSGPVVTDAAPGVPDAALPASPVVQPATGGIKNESQRDAGPRSDLAVLDPGQPGTGQSSVDEQLVSYRPIGNAHLDASHRARPQHDDTTQIPADTLDSSALQTQTLSSNTLPAGLMTLTAAQPVAVDNPTAVSTTVSTTASTTASAAPNLAPASVAPVSATIAHATTAADGTASALPAASAATPVDAPPATDATRSADTTHAHAVMTQATGTASAPAPAAATAATSAADVHTSAQTRSRDAGTGSRVTAVSPAGSADTFTAVASAQQLQQPAPASIVAPTAATTAAADTTAATAMTQPELTQSLVHLHSRGNGEHEMSVSLHPAELGAVHVRALLHDGVLTVTIACADESARHAVTAALPDLHHQLAGLKELDVNLTGGQSDARSSQARAHADLHDGSSRAHREETGSDGPATSGRTERADRPGSVSTTNTVRRSGGRNDTLDRWM